MSNREVTTDEPLNLPKYRSHKVVEAFRISHIEPFDNDGAYLYGEEGDQGWRVYVGGDWLAKHEPKGGGYFVRYEDGYESWSPAEAFEGGYTRICVEEDSGPWDQELEGDATEDNERIRRAAERRHIMTEAELQAAIDARPSPVRVTREGIEARIRSRHFTVLPDTTVTICSLTLDNGYSVRGESACVDPANFDQAIGRQLAEQDAFRKLWPLFGFLLAEDVHRGALTRPAD